MSLNWTWHFLLTKIKWVKLWRMSYILVVGHNRLQMTTSKFRYLNCTIVGGLATVFFLESTTSTTWPTSVCIRKFGNRLQLLSADFEALWYLTGYYCFQPPRYYHRKIFWSSNYKGKKLILSASTTDIWWHSSARFERLAETYTVLRWIPRLTSGSQLVMGHFIAWLYRRGTKAISEGIDQVCSQHRAEIKDNLFPSSLSPVVQNLHCWASPISNRLSPFDVLKWVESEYRKICHNLNPKFCFSYLTTRTQAIPLAVWFVDFSQFAKRIHWIVCQRRRRVSIYSNCQITRRRAHWETNYVMLCPATLDSNYRKWKRTRYWRSIFWLSDRRWFYFLNRTTVIANTNLSWNGR